MAGRLRRRRRSVGRSTCRISTAGSISTRSHPRTCRAGPYYKHVSAHWPDVRPNLQPADPARRSNPDRPVPGRHVRPQRRVPYRQVLPPVADRHPGQGDSSSCVTTRSWPSSTTTASTLAARICLQSASKTLAGVVTHQLIDAGSLAADAHGRIPSCPASPSTTIGDATVQQVLDHTSGARTLLDFHTAGTPDQHWEVEVGLQAGTATGHRQAHSRRREGSPSRAPPGTIQRQEHRHAGACWPSRRPGDASRNFWRTCSMPSVQMTPARSP